MYILYKIHEMESAKGASPSPYRHLHARTANLKTIHCRAFREWSWWSSRTPHCVARFTEIFLVASWWCLSSH